MTKQEKNMASLLLQVFQENPEVLGLPKEFFTVKRFLPFPSVITTKIQVMFSRVRFSLDNDEWRTEVIRQMVARGVPFRNAIQRAYKVSPPKLFKDNVSHV